MQIKKGSAPRDTIPQVLVVDDDPAVLGLVQEALTHYGMRVHPFSHADEVIQLLEQDGGTPFDLVISDINMEGLDGFDVVRQVKAIHPSLPVVLMTGEANLDYAIQAMRLGAANLFPKPLAIKDLVNAVFHLVGVHRELRMAQSGLLGLIRETRHFSFRSDELNIPSTVVHLTDRLVPLGFASPSNVDVIAMAYHEALVNALEHGNLEVDSSLKGDLFAVKDHYAAMLQERLLDPTFAERRIDVELEATPERFRVVVTDAGQGYDTTTVTANQGKNRTGHFGRGLAMIHMVMDEVTFNEKGNEIRMTLWKKRHS